MAEELQRCSSDDVWWVRKEAVLILLLHQKQLLQANADAHRRGPTGEPGVSKQPASCQASCHSHLSFNRVCCGLKAHQVCCRFLVLR